MIADAVGVLSNAGIAAVIAGLIAGFFGLRAQKMASAVESRRVSVEEFHAHSEFYERELERQTRRVNELQTEVDALRAEMRKR